MNGNILFSDPGNSVTLMIVMYTPSNLTVDQGLAVCNEGVGQHEECMLLPTIELQPFLPVLSKFCFTTVQSISYPILLRANITTKRLSGCWEIFAKERVRCWTGYTSKQFTARGCSERSY